jgi:hypothetical protein
MSVEQRLREDFGFFLFMIWQHLQLPNPTPLQQDIGLYLSNGPERCVIEAFRGCGKSFVTSAFVIWCLYRDPQLKIMVVSASKERADAFSQFVKRLIAEVSFLQHLMARNDQRNSNISFDVGPALTDHSPSVKSVGITGQLTGSRANIIIADDIEVANNSYTQDSRDKLAEAVKEFDAIIKPYDKATMREKPRIIFLGTPQTEMSLYNQLPERGYEVRIWPVLYPTDKQMIGYKGRLAPSITEPLEDNLVLPGESTEPLRFDLADIEKRRLSYGKAGFALQFMLDTSLSDADKYPLKLSDLVVMPVDMEKAPVEFTKMNGPETLCKDIESVGLTGDRYYRPYWVSKERQGYTGSLLTIDPSGRGKDETAWNVTKFYNGYIYLADEGGMKEGYTEKTLGDLAKIAKTHKVNCVRIESNFGDGMFAQLLKPYLTRIHPCQIDEKRNSHQKELRIIETCEPVMMQHRLVIDPRLIQKDLDANVLSPHYSLFYQMSRIAAERGALKHDDRLDCLELAIDYWSDWMSADASKLEDERREEAMLEFLAKYDDTFTIDEEDTWM